MFILLIFIGVIGTPYLLYRHRSAVHYLTAGLINSPLQNQIERRDQSGSSNAQLSEVGYVDDLMNNKQGATKGYVFYLMVSLFMILCSIGHYSHLICGLFKSVIKRLMINARNPLSLCVILTLGLVACGGSDEPMPFNDETLEQFTDAFEELVEEKREAISGISNNRIQLKTVITEIYKPVIEDMGYGFDITMRHYRFYHKEKSTNHPWRRNMDDAYFYLRDNYKEAFENGLITKTNFELFELQNKAKEPISRQQENVLAYVTECQKRNNGICTLDILSDLLPKDYKALDELIAPSHRQIFQDRIANAKVEAKQYAEFLAHQKKIRAKRSGSTQSSILTKYDPESKIIRVYQQAIYSPVAQWILTEDGKDVRYNFFDMLQIKNQGFKVNQEKLAFSRQLTSMMNNEKELLNIHSGELS